MDDAHTVWFLPFPILSITSWFPRYATWNRVRLEPESSLVAGAEPAGNCA